MSLLLAVPFGPLAWSGITFVAGVALKGTFDSYLRLSEQSKKFELDKRTGYLEQQLSRFYWPLYLHLQKDNLIWERMLERDQDPLSGASRLSLQIEAGVILPNHQEALAVIETNLHLAGDAAVVEVTLRYVRHVMVYKMLRDAGLKDDPVSHGEPYPRDIFPLINQRVHDLQAEYAGLIRLVQKG